MSTRYPVQVSAQQAVAKALRDGAIVRLPCSVCGDAKSESHHEDYGDPLNVQWLCRKHHRATHKGRRVGPPPATDAPVHHLMKIDKEKWDAFKARLKHDGHTVKWILESLIDDYIAHGRMTRPRNTKKDTDR